MQAQKHAAEERLPPSPDDIRTQIHRIVSDPSFPGSGRCGAFLRYVTEETLAGREQRIKGYTIAIEVFGRGEDFSQDDPVVRIEAGRLRRALELYYLIAGQDDPILIDIAKGGYVPTFTWLMPKSTAPELVPESAAPHETPRSRRSMTATTSLVILGAAGVGCLLTWSLMPPSGTKSNVLPTPPGPTLIVAPFQDLGGGSESRVYAAGLTEELLTALPRFKEIKVFGRETTAALLNSDSDDNVGRESGARFLLAGGVRVSGSQVRVTARLLDTATKAILWSNNYDGNLDARSLFSIQKEVADKVATAVAQPYGVIARTDIAHLPPDDLDAYSCTLRFYAYRADLSVEQHADVRTCLEDAVAHYPTYATAWAMLSMIYLDENRFRYNERSDAPTAVKRSLDAARQAVALDPENARGLQALMTALYFNRQPQESLRVGEQALAVNPNDTELLSEFGSRLALSGQWQRGAAVMEEALSRNPGAAGYFRGVLALAEYMQGNYGKAVIEIRQANIRKFPLFHIVAAVIYAERGMIDEAKRESQEFALMGSDYLVNLTDELETRLGRPQDRERILAGLKKAGLNPLEAPAGPATLSPAAATASATD
jgi:adenylate cyclase